MPSASPNLTVRAPWSPKGLHGPGDAPARPLPVACVPSRFSRVFAPLWTATRQAPLSMGFSRQEYWSELPCPSPGGLPAPGIEPVSLMPPALAGVLYHQRPRKPHGPCSPPPAGPQSSTCLAGSSMRAGVSPALFRAEDMGMQQAPNRYLKEQTNKQKQ